MEMIKPEFEIGDVSIPISLTFEGFHFVIDSLDRATKDFVDEVVQQAITV